MYIYTQYKYRKSERTIDKMCWRGKLLRKVGHFEFIKF